MKKDGKMVNVQYVRRDCPSRRIPLEPVMPKMYTFYCADLNVKPGDLVVVKCAFGNRPDHLAVTVVSEVGEDINIEEAIAAGWKPVVGIVNTQACDAFLQSYQRMQELRRDIQATVDGEQLLVVARKFAASNPHLANLLTEYQRLQENG